MRAEQTFVVTRREFAASVRDRLGFDGGVRVFSAAEAEHALTGLLQHPGAVVALDRRFISSPQGTEFVQQARLACPDIDLRVLADHGSDTPLLLRRPTLPTGRATVAALSHTLKGLPRRAPRYPVQPGCEALVNGESTNVVDVSIAGAQLLAGNILRPAQPVRVAFTDEHEMRIKAEGEVAWSRFERSTKTGATCYRAGLHFTKAEAELLEAYCRKHALPL